MVYKGLLKYFLFKKTATLNPYLFQLYIQIISKVYGLLDGDLVFKEDLESRELIV